MSEPARYALVVFRAFWPDGTRLPRGGILCIDLASVESAVARGGEVIAREWEPDALAMFRLEECDE